MATPLEQPKERATSLSRRRRSGYECDFVEKPQQAFQAECPVCLQILCEPYQVTCCGYSFCKECIKQIEADKKSCPTCNEKNFTTFHDKRLQRSLYEFHVTCTHKQQGCEWTGELGQLDKHLNLNPQPDKQLQGCQYSEIECMYCLEAIQRHTITTHQADLCPKRPFSCEYCHNYQSDYDDVIHNHWPVCGFHPVRCPNECGTFPQRQNLQTHITNKCPLTVIACDFHHVGCDVNLPRKDMPTHLKENLVTHMSLHVVSHTEQMNKLDMENEILKTQLKQTLAENQHLQQKYSQLEEEIVKMREQNQILSTSPANHHFIAYVGTPTPGYVEFTMSNYEKHKKNDDCWYSPPFYTHLQGYKMCLKVWANNGIGRTKGTHVSVLVCLMRGEFDDHLKWPFRGDITIQLVDRQEREEENHSVTVQYNDKTSVNYTGRVEDGERQRESWGFNKFISNDKLRPKYLKNDSLCFRISKIVLM